CSTGQSRRGEWRDGGIAGQYAWLAPETTQLLRRMPGVSNLTALTAEALFADAPSGAAAWLSRPRPSPGANHRRKNPEPAPASGTNRKSHAAPVCPRFFQGPTSGRVPHGESILRLVPS